MRRTRTTQLSKVDWPQSREPIRALRLLAIFISIKRSLITSLLAEWFGCPAHVRGASERNGSSFNDVLHLFAELYSISVTEQLLPKLQRGVTLCSRYTDCWVDWVWRTLVVVHWKLLQSVGEWIRRIDCYSDGLWLRVVDWRRQFGIEIDAGVVRGCLWESKTQASRVFNSLQPYVAQDTELLVAT